MNSATAKPIELTGTRPVQRAEFIAPQMLNGVNRINEIQDSAPALSDI